MLVQFHRNFNVAFLRSIFFPNSASVAKNIDFLIHINEYLKRLQYSFSPVSIKLYHLHIQKLN